MRRLKAPRWSSTPRAAAWSASPPSISISKLPKNALAADIIYIPLETPFLAAARKRGNRTVNGLGMLLNQGRPAWKAWFGIEPEVTAELRAMIERTI